MANSIITIEKYLPLLDETFSHNALTRDLEASDVLFDGTSKIKIKKIKTPDPRNYDRNKGFITGDAGVSWETQELKQDRQIVFDIDRMDNEETLGNTFGQIAGEAIRIKQVPEVDLYRFSTIASDANVTTKQADIATGEDLLTAIDEMEENLRDAGVLLENVILYISNANYTKLKSTNNFQRFATTTDRVLNRNITTFDDMKLVVVPTSRFYSATEYKDINGTKEGALVKTAEAKVIDFIGVEPRAVDAVMKYVTLRAFDASINQEKDAYLFQLRYYHDLFVYDEKANGVYVHLPETNA